MSEEQQDSFELFVDTLTITLGCIIFIGLLLVIINQSHLLDESGLFHLQQRSEILEKQVAAGRKEVERIEMILSEKLTNDSHAAKRIQAHEARMRHHLEILKLESDSHYTEAILSENKRHTLFLAQAPWITAAVAETHTSLSERISRAFAEATETPIALSVLREQSEIKAKPVYWLIQRGQFFPVPGGPGSPYDYVEWARPEDPHLNNRGSLWQLIPKALGMRVDEGLRELERSAAKIRKPSEFQIVLLVYSDSFAEARQALRLLGDSDAHFSWRPMEMHQRVLMAPSGLPPDAPF